MLKFYGDSHREQIQKYKGGTASVSTRTPSFKALQGGAPPQIPSLKWRADDKNLFMCTVSDGSTIVWYPLYFGSHAGSTEQQHFRKLFHEVLISKPSSKKKKKASKKEKVTYVEQTNVTVYTLSPSIMPPPATRMVVLLS